MSDGETFAFLTFPKLAPEKACGDYLQSKLEEQALKKYPQWDYPRREPLIHLAGTKRDLHKVKLQLIEKKNDAVKQREKLDVQWKDLERMALKIRETFCEFDKMITENSQKRGRATAKTQKQTMLQTERDKAIEDLRKDYDNLVKIKDEMEDQIKKHSIYEEYLQTIAEAHPEYMAPKDVFNKFGALDEARNTLTERLDQYLTSLENVKYELLQSMKDQNSALIGLNNRVAELHERHSAAKREAQKWGEIVQKIQNGCGAKLMEILNVRQACWNIYLDMCERRKVKPQFKKSDFENHLCCIKKTILKLRRTLEIAHQKREIDVGSVCVEIPVSKRLI